MRLSVLPSNCVNDFVGYGTAEWRAMKASSWLQQ